MAKSNGEDVKTGKDPFTWDIGIKLFSIVITLSTIFYGYVDYKRMKEKEYANEISKMQINYFSEFSESIGELVAIISNQDSFNSSTYYRKKARFKDLFYGKSNMISDTAIISSGIKFHKDLDSLEADMSDWSVFYILEEDVRRLNANFRAAIKKTYNIDEEKPVRLNNEF